MSGAGSKIFGKDYLNSTAGLDVWIPLRLLPDGSISVTSSTVVDEGIATGGLTTQLTDTTKDWEVNIFEGATIEIIHAGVTYHRTVNGNIANTIGFATLGVIVAAGDIYRIMRSIDPMTPIDKGVIHNTAYLTPNNFFGTALTPYVVPTLFRCQGAFSVAGVLSVTIIRGGNTQVVEFNHGVALPASALFEFDTLVQDSTTINYRYSVNCTIMTFSVLEIPAAI
ncbi:MAG: hypothetical protein WC359_14480 [Dehalococcoidia bacterium]|jgi:hypothetical protein